MAGIRTVDKQFTQDDSWWGRLRRDARLLLRMARMLRVYLVVGGRIRRAYRAKEQQGEIYWVDEAQP